MKKLLVLLGSTSSGKTDAAIYLAKKFNGELISADSRQVYKNLDIGTGKLPSINSKVSVEKGEGYWVLDGVKVWLYDLLYPDKRYDVSQFVTEARDKIEEVNFNNKLPIIVGGTGFYIRSLIDGFSNSLIPLDQNLRKTLEKLSLIELQTKLQNISSKAWNQLNNSDKNNPRRLVRKIELLTLKPKLSKKGFPGLTDFEILKIGLFAKREKLNQRIDKRVDSRIEQGLIEEGKRLYIEGLSLGRMRELGLEYGVLADFLENKLDEKQFSKKLKIKIRQFTKRQMTYFKKEKDVIWIDVAKHNFMENLEKRVVGWYKS